MIPTITRLGARSVWKGPHIVPLPVANAIKNKTPIRTKARNCTIIPQFVGLKLKCTTERICRVGSDRRHGRLKIG